MCQRGQLYLRSESALRLGASLYRPCRVETSLEGAQRAGDQFLKTRARCFSVKNITTKGRNSADATEIACAKSSDSMACHRHTCKSIRMNASAASVVPAKRFAACQVASLIIDRGDP